MTITPDLASPLRLIRYILVLISLSHASTIYGQGNSAPPSFTWSQYDFISTGGGYSLGSGQISRSVVDLRVAGSVGEQPLTWSRTLRQINGIRILDVRWGPVWSFSYDYLLTRQDLGNSTLDDPVVRYPSGVSIKFSELESDGRHAANCSDFLVVSTTNGVERWELRSANGTSVFFEPDGTNTRQIPTRIRDRYGLQTTISYNSSRKADQVTDASGRWIKIEYQGAGDFAKPVRVFSSDGQQVSYQWASGIDWADNRLTGAIYSDGTTASYTYLVTARGYLPDTCRDVRSTSPVRNIKYDFEQRITPINDFAGARLQRERDADSGAVISERLTTNNWMQERRGDGATRTLAVSILSTVMPFETDYLGNTQSYTYHVRGGFKSITDPRGNVTQYEREPVFGLPTKITYPDASFETLEYTGRYPLFVNRRVSVRGHVTTYDLFDNGVIGEIHFPDGSAEGWNGLNAFNQPGIHRFRNGANEVMSYDSKGRLLSRSTPFFAGDPVGYTNYTYYPDGHPWADRIQTVTDALGHTTTYEYDLLFVNNVQSSTPCAGRGLITKIINPDGTYQSFGYNIYGDKIWEENELRQRTTYEYDGYGRVVRRIDPLNHGTVTTYQINGNSTAVQSITSPEGRRVEFRYDSNLNKIEEISAPGTSDEAHVWFSYDSSGNLITRTQQADGGNRVFNYSYDSRNRKITESAPLGRTTDFGYDAASNNTWIHYPDGTSITKDYDAMNQMVRSYDEMGRATNYIYYPSGKLRWVIDPNNNSYSYWYDASDRLTFFWLTNIDQTNFDYEQTTYDLAGNVSQFRNRSGSWKTFTYDNRNREKSVTWNDGITPSISTDYDNAGRIVQRSNSTSTLSYRYDAAGRLIEERQALAGGPTSTITYEYDADGNRTKLSKR